MSSEGFILHDLTFETHFQVDTSSCNTSVVNLSDAVVLEHREPT